MISKPISKRIAGSLLSVACALAISTPNARSETRHTLVLPGTCITFGTATVTFHRNALTLTSSGPESVAAAVVTSTIPGIGLSNFPIPQGILTFTAVHKYSSNEYANQYQIVAFYQNGSVVLRQGSLSNGTTNFSVNTEENSMGQLLAVSFLYAGGEENVGVVTVSNFRINNIPALGFDLTHPQNCAPYVPPILSNACAGCT